MQIIIDDLLYVYFLGPIYGVTLTLVNWEVLRAVSLPAADGGADGAAGGHGSGRRGFLWVRH